MTTKDAGIDGPPSYEESTQAQYTNPSHSSTVHSLLYDEIVPRLQPSPYSTRLRSRTLVIVPSNVTTLQTGAQDSKTAVQGKLVGFPSNEEPELIHLSSSEHTIEYWRQLDPPKELIELLRQYLYHQGYTTAENSTDKRSTGWMNTSKPLGDREASLVVGVQNVCMRVENEIGLFEARNGGAIVVRVKIGGQIR